MTYTDPRTSINVLENMMRVDILTICTTYIKVLGEFVYGSLVNQAYYYNVVVVVEINTY